MQKYKKKSTDALFSKKKVLSLCIDLQKIMSRLYSIVDFLGRHKNWIVVLFCILYVGVLDSNSLWDRHYRWQSIKELKAEIAQLEADFEEDTRGAGCICQNLCRGCFIKNDCSDATHVNVCGLS